MKQIDRHQVENMLGNGAQIPLKNFGRETARLLDSYRPVIVYCHDYQ